MAPWLVTASFGVNHLKPMTSDATSSPPQRRTDLVFRQLDEEEWVIFDPAAERLHALNVTAALVWSRLSGELDMRQIAEEVGAAFDPPVAGENVVHDVQDTIKKFRAGGLLA